MDRQQIFLIILLTIVVLAAAGLGLFYLKPQLEEVAADEAYVQDLKQALKYYEDTFSSTEPDVLVQLWIDAVEPWQGALEARRRRFDLQDELEIPELPEDPMLYSFFYREQYAALIQDYRLYAWNHRVAIPNTTFNVPDPATIQGSSLSPEDLARWLEVLKFGGSTIKMLVDQGAAQVNQVRIWEPTVEQNVLEVWPIGLSITMTLQNCVKFFDQLANAPETFCDISGIRLNCGNLAASANPYLTVEMVLVRANYIEPKAPQSGAGPQAGRAPGASSSMKLQLAPKKKPWWKFW